MFSYYAAPPKAPMPLEACAQAVEKPAVQRNPRRGHLALAGRYTNRALESEVAVEPTVLGRGAFPTVVHRASHRESGRAFALKTISKQGFSGDQLTEVRCEMESYLALDNPHLAVLEKIYETESDIHLMMENCEGQELFDRICQRGRFTEGEAARAMRQMLVAVSYMHSREMVHRDLKPENFLYERKDNEFLKLIDFGFARRWDRKANMTRFCGTTHFMAPEVMAESYTEKADMWSLGVILYIMLCGAPPWHTSNEKTMKMIRAGEPYYARTLFEPLSPGAKALIKALMAKDPSSRPSAVDAIGNPWICSFNAAGPSLDPALVRNLQGFSQLSPVRRTCLAMAAWSLPGRVQERLRENFKVLCSDNCGAISLHEFVQALVAVGMTGSEAEVLFRSLDQDRDGEIAYTEFLAGAVTSEDLEVDTLHLTFSRFDADGNGSINAEDLRKVLGKKFKGHAVLDLITEADQSGNGAVSFEDFSKFLRPDRCESECGSLSRTASSASIQDCGGEVCKGQCPPNLVTAQPIAGPKSLLTDLPPISSAGLMSAARATMEADRYEETHGKPCLLFSAGGQLDKLQAMRMRVDSQASLSSKGASYSRWAQHGHGRWGKADTGSPTTSASSELAGDGPFQN